MKIIVAKKTGRLGNRLVLSTHLAAMAIEKNSDLINIPFLDYLEYFSVFPGVNKNYFFKFKIISCFLYFLNRISYKMGKLIKLIPSLGVFSYRDSDAPTLNLVELFSDQNIKIIFLQGYKFRAGILVKKHEKQLREIICPSDSILKKVRSKINSKKMNVGVHIRQGDYATYLNGIFFYSIDMYFDWMVSLSSSLNVRFIVCSDSLLSASIFPGLDVMVVHGNEAEDIFTLAACDLVMGPPSSFSSWAAWWGNKPLLRLYKDTKNISMDNFIIQKFPDNPDCI